MLTDDDEGVVNVDTAKAIGGFTNEGPSILCLHIFDSQSLLKDPEAHPTTVDVSSIFGPHDEGWRITLHRTLKFHGASNSDGLPVGNLLCYTWRSYKKQDYVNYCHCRVLSGFGTNSNPSLC